MIIYQASAPENKKMVIVMYIQYGVVCHVPYSLFHTLRKLLFSLSDILASILLHYDTHLNMIAISERELNALSNTFYKARRDLFSHVDVLSDSLSVNVTYISRAA